MQRGRVAAASSPEASTGGLPLRRLILMRHADSADGSAKVRDHDRKLTDLGVQQAGSTASALKAQGWVPDVVLASNARRTKQTLEAMGEAMQELEDVDAHLYGSLYTISALDGQTRQHIEVGGGADRCLLDTWKLCRCRCSDRPAQWQSWHRMNACSDGFLWPVPWGGDEGRGWPMQTARMARMG
jgi:hypothetical protein